MQGGMAGAGFGQSLDRAKMGDAMQQAQIGWLNRGNKETVGNDGMNDGISGPQKGLMPLDIYGGNPTNFDMPRSSWSPINKMYR